jgi:hypothetical protein
MSSADELDAYRIEQTTVTYWGICPDCQLAEDGSSHRPRSGSGLQHFSPSARNTSLTTAEIERRAFS